MAQLESLDCTGKVVLVRVDFNVPLDENFHVTDDTRLQSSKPTIDYLVGKGAKVVLMSHMGRPKGQVNPDFSLKHIASNVEKVMGKPIHFVEDCIGDSVKNAVEQLQNGDILLLENLRFYNEEEAGDSSFAKSLADIADFYVNDAFGTAHRAHASTAIIASYFDNDHKSFGFLMNKELEAIDKVLHNSEKPVTAIVGGSKVSSKITIIENLLPAVDNLIIGGGMAYTFIQALGGKIGDSIVEPDYQETALSILKSAENQNVKVYLPTDNIIADDFSNDANIKTVSYDSLSNCTIDSGWQGLDIGPKTIEVFSDVITHSKTILWNGPVGVFEMEKFKNGTMEIAYAIEKATKNGAFSLVGGGDSVAFVKQNNFEDKVSYVSTGGGAMLESLEGKELPGVSAINS